MKNWYPVKVFISVLVFLGLAYCRNILYADPDFIRSAIAAASEKTPQLNIGQHVCWKRICLGGMVEIRNESRFNQKIFPNHNWRGTAIIDYLILSHETATKQVNSYLNLFHESAHPTMGIFEETENAYELIYDHKYRTMVLNSINWAASYRQDLLSGLFLTQIGVNIYLLSKNTPELTGKKLTHGYGFNGGFQWEYPFLKKNRIYLSFFNRVIFKGKVKSEGNIYFGSGKHLAEKTVKYPVINKTYTLSLKSGVNRLIGSTDMKLGIFTHFIYGNPYGFIDSRDKRSVLRVGVEVFQ